MQISEVRVRKVNAGKLLAIASVTIDKAFAIHDFKIFDGTNGLFVSMPSRKTPEGEYRDTAHPITADARSQIIDAVTVAYHKA